MTWQDDQKPIKITERHILTIEHAVMAAAYKKTKPLKMETIFASIAVIKAFKAGEQPTSDLIDVITKEIDIESDEIYDIGWAPIGG